MKLQEFFESMGIDIDATKKSKVIEFFNDVAFAVLEEFPIPYKETESQPMKLHDVKQQRGDGMGYETFIIFEKKSDNTFWYYYIYDGRFERDELEQTEKIVKVQWDFETSYS